MTTNQPDSETVCSSVLWSEGHAYLGKQPPGTAMLSQVASRVQIGDVDWATMPDILLNHGLVAVIGARIATWDFSRGQLPLWLFHQQPSTPALKMPAEPEHHWSYRFPA